MATGQRCCLQIWSPPSLPSTSVPVNPIRSRAGRGRRCSLHVTSSYKPKPDVPPLNEFRTRAQIQRLFLKDWMKTTATEDVNAKSIVNTRTILTFLPYFLKYYCTPMIARYFVYLFWLSLRRRVLYPLQKKVVKVDCMIDAFLAKVGSGGKQVGFSKGAAFSRFHFRIGFFGDLKYRVGLLRGGDLGDWRKVYKEPQPKFVVPEEYKDKEEMDEASLAMYLDPGFEYGSLEPKPL